MRTSAAFLCAACVVSLPACKGPQDIAPSKATPTAPSDTGPHAAEPKQPAPTATATEKPLREEPMPDPITHPCVVAAVNYDQAIERGRNDCKSDAECGCYQGGIGKSGCGGVLNKDSVKELDAIAKRFHDMKCSLSTQCAAWACQPKCQGGQCRR